MMSMLLHADGFAAVGLRVFQNLNLGDGPDREYETVIDLDQPPLRIEAGDFPGNDGLQLMVENLYGFFFFDEFSEHVNTPKTSLIS